MIPPIFKKLIVKADSKKERKRYFFESFLAGLAATSAYLVFLYPLDVLRVRLATDIGFKQSREFSGPTNCLAKILKTDGLMGLYSGFSC